jgi:hypothetical protein
MKKCCILVAVMVLLSIMPFVSSSGVPYVVYGYVKDYSGTLKNGITVIVRDATKMALHPNSSSEYTIMTTTLKGAVQDGLYQANLGNLIGSWDRGDEIYVYSSFWLDQIHYYGSAHFTIPSGGYMFQINVSTDNMEYTPGGEEILPPPPPGNVPPTLSELSLSKTEGKAGDIFYYNVTYRDANNEKPYSIFAVIDGIYHGMSFVSFASGNYTTGVRYSYRTTIPEGDHTFWFYTTDGYAGSFSSTTSTDGPHVFYQPTLSGWGVTPMSGTLVTYFTYTVVYTDKEGLDPVYVFVSVTGPNGTGQYPMIKTSGEPTSGATYKCTVNNHSLAPSTYEIVVSDGNYRVSTRKFDGPLVLLKAPASTFSKSDDLLIKGIMFIIIVIIVIAAIIYTIRKRKKKEKKEARVELPAVQWQPLQQVPQQTVVRSARRAIIPNEETTIIRRQRQPPQQ